MGYTAPLLFLYKDSFGIKYWYAIKQIKQNQNLGLNFKKVSTNINGER